MPGYLLIGEWKVNHSDINFILLRRTLKYARWIYDLELVSGNNQYRLHLGASKQLANAIPMKHELESDLNLRQNIYLWFLSLVALIQMIDIFR